jgi:hypothetical protein
MILPCTMAMLTTAILILVYFLLLGGTLGHCAIYTHANVQPVALHCSLAAWAAAWATLRQSAGSPWACMVRFMFPNCA